MRNIIVLGITLSLAACSYPDRYVDGELTEKDSHTSYHVKDHPDGFTMTILYERYNFFGGQAKTGEAGKARLLGMCYEYGEEKGKPIQEVNEQRIVSSRGRDCWGVNRWSGQVRCFFKVP